MLKWRLTIHLLWHMQANSADAYTKTSNRVPPCANTCPGRCANFPLSVETPLPNDTSGAAIFSRDCPPGQLRSFWASQLCKLEKMALYSELTQQKWDKAIPDGIKPAAGKLKTVALSHLMRQCVLKGEKSGFACLPMASRLPGNCRRGLRISCRRSTKRFFPAPAYMRQLPLASRNAQLNLAMQMPRCCGAKL